MKTELIYLNFLVKISPCKLNVIIVILRETSSRSELNGANTKILYAASFQAKPNMPSAFILFRGIEGSAWFMFGVSKEINSKNVTTAEVLNIPCHIIKYWVKGIHILRLKHVIFITFQKTVIKSELAICDFHYDLYYFWYLGLFYATWNEWKLCAFILWFL